MPEPIPGGRHMFLGGIPLARVLCGRFEPSFAGTPRLPGWGSTAQPAQGPVNLITKITVRLDPAKEEIPCAELPFKYTPTFTITTTGPVTVKYEADLSRGQVIDPTPYVFTASGTKIFTEEFKVDAAGDHWFQVGVLSPNVISGTGNAKLARTP